MSNARPPRLSSPGIDVALDEIIAAGEVGVQIAAAGPEGVVVDAWAGTLGTDDGRHVDGATLFPIFSVSKAVTASAVHLQAHRGLVSYDAPIAAYWPEYARKGKDRITVRHVLMHRAGVPQMPDDVTVEQMCDWDWMIRRLAEQEPVREPGRHNTYLSMVFGWILGEVVRRTDPDDRSFGRFVAEELCEPLGMDGFFFGVTAAERDRIATLSFPAPPAPPPEGSLVRRAVPPQVGLNPNVFNRTDVQAACIPAVGGIANAASMARFFAMVANRGRVGERQILGAEQVCSFLRQRDDYWADDETYGKHFPMGAGGFWLTAPGVLPAVQAHVAGRGSPRRILAHTGAGGSIGWADLETGHGYAICHNRMIGATPAPPFARLAAEVRHHLRVTDDVSD